MTLPIREVPYTLFTASSGKNKIENDIMDFTNLPTGWHYGKGGPTQPGVVKIALQLHHEAIAIGFRETEASPGRNGEVLLSFFYENHCIDLVIESDLSISYYHEIDGDVVETVKNLTLEKAKARLIRFGVLQWNVFASFTLGTTAPKSDALTGSLLRTMRV